MHLSGDVPTGELFKMVHLESINLKSNDINFNSFDGIDKLTKLETLILFQTRLSSAAGIGAATSVKNLHLTSNELTSIPDDIYDLTQLESLYTCTCVHELQQDHRNIITKDW